MVTISHISAFCMFLRDYPNLRVDKMGAIFWYDDKQDKYFYQKPSNKVRNGIIEARGLQSAYDALVRRF